MEYTQANSKRIAIIGFGVASAVSSYYLRQQLLRNSNVEITIFEKEPVLGGRIKTAVDLDAHRLEAGADTLTVDDWCMEVLLMRQASLRIHRDGSRDLTIPCSSWILDISN
jgi:protoporphyrinogen oxidase